MKCAVMLGMALAAAAAWANEIEYLWPKDAMPDRQSHQIAALTCDVKRPGFVRSEHVEPYLEWYDRPAGSPSNDVCVMLISGGGYNAQCDEMDALAEEGRIFMIEPSEPVTVARVEGDMEKLGALYWLGYNDGKRTLEALKAYLNN